MTLQQKGTEQVMMHHPTCVTGFREE